MTIELALWPVPVAFYSGYIFWHSLLERLRRDLPSRGIPSYNDLSSLSRCWQHPSSRHRARTAGEMVLVHHQYVHQQQSFGSCQRIPTPRLGQSCLGADEIGPTIGG